jgi:hypothetical protein
MVFFERDIMLAVPVALTVWAFRTAIGGRRLWKSDLLG